MSSVHAKMDDSGRVLLPKSVREELGWKPGTALIVEVAEEGSLRISTLQQAVQRAQDYCRTLKTGESAVDEFLRERRQEAEDL